MTSLTFGYPLVAGFLQTGLVPRLPTAVLVSAIMLSALFSPFAGLVLDLVTFARPETKRLTYLQLAPPSRPVRSGSTQAAEHRSSTDR